jgi:hypothetical protein
MCPGCTSISTATPAPVPCGSPPRASIGKVHLAYVTRDTASWPTPKGDGHWNCSPARHQHGRAARSGSLRSALSTLICLIPNGRSPASREWAMSMPVRQTQASTAPCRMPMLADPCNSAAQTYPLSQCCRDRACWRRGFHDPVGLRIKHQAADWRRV